MTQRSSNYPLDASTRYPLGGAPGPELSDTNRPEIYTTDDEGQPTHEVLYNSIRRGAKRGYVALAYLDLLDRSQEALHTRIGALAGQLAATQQQLAAARGDIQTLQDHLSTLLGFFGVLIPAWINKEEVEQGDDMGMVRPSAAELGLVVDYQFDQRRPGFSHEEVVSITPAPGTLVARGSTVTVVLNLEG